MFLERFFFFLKRLAREAFNHRGGGGGGEAPEAVKTKQMRSLKHDECQN